MRPFLILLALAGMLTAASAQTVSDDRYPSWGNRMRGYQQAREWRWRAARERGVRRGKAARSAIRAGVSGRPAKWCGWFLGRLLGMPDRKLWLARNWASVGRDAGDPGVGVIVVWRHHVGIITGKTSQGWVVKSGNDGHAVRERVRSVNRAIAYRRVG